MVNAKKLPLNRCDCFAVSVFVTLYGWLFYRVPRLAIIFDEATYLVYVQRFMQGYKPFIDDWGAEQLCAPFQYLPYKLYTMIHGDNQGAILFMRYCYLFVCMILFWYLYAKLRTKGLWGLFAVSAFSCYIPGSIAALNYYTMHVHGLAILCAILFLTDRPGKLKKVFAGFVFACTVMIEPPLVALYLIFSLLVVLRAVLRRVGKHALGAYSFVVNAENWLLISAGCLIVFALFLGWIHFTGGILKTIKAFPLFLRNVGYDYTPGGSSYAYIRGSVQSIATVYGKTSLVFMPLLTAAAILVKHKRRNASAVRVVFFSSILYLGLLLLVYTVFYLPFVGDPDQKPYWPHYLSVMPTVPLLCLGLICHILMTNKNRKLFCIWCVGAVSAFFVDLVSEMTACVSFAVGILSVILLLPEAIADIGAAEPVYKNVPRGNSARRNAQQAKRLTKTNAKIRNQMKVCLIAIVAVLCAVEVCNVYTEGYFGKWRHPENSAVKLTDGVFKGIYNSEELFDKYNRVRSGVLQIPGSPSDLLHIAHNCPELYLDADCRISVCDAWFYVEDSFDRQVNWWKLHPDMLPDYIYIPRYYYDPDNPNPEEEAYVNQCLQLYKDIFESEETYSDGGIILKVKTAKL